VLLTYGYIAINAKPALVRIRFALYVAISANPLAPLVAVASGHSHHAEHGSLLLSGRLSYPLEHLSGHWHADSFSFLGANPWLMQSLFVQI